MIGESSWELKQDYLSLYALFLTIIPCNTGEVVGSFFRTGTAYPEIIHRIINGCLFILSFIKYILINYFVPIFVVRHSLLNVRETKRFRHIPYPFSRKVKTIIFASSFDLTLLVSLGFIIDLEY